MHELDGEENSNEERKIKCTDLSYLTRRTKADPKLMAEMICLYLGQTESLIASMKQGVLDKDWKLLHSSAHKMIPSFSIVGISKDFENMAKKVQEYAGTQQHTDQIPDLVLQLINVLEKASEELEEELEMLKTTCL
jgi:HPt (histidine-containing phosphotransfer) domain-containing protein